MGAILGATAQCGLMPAFSRRQLAILIVLTVVWGLNWPVMKLGVTGLAPLTFRAMCMWLAVPMMGLALAVLKAPLAVPRAHWGTLLWLGVVNMVLWHGLAIVAISTLSSGRAAILGYTMPIFSAVLGALAFGDRLAPRAWGGVAAAALGVLLLLWHELAHLGGRPLGVAFMLLAAASWALGTQLLRRSRIPVPTLTLAFWMTVETAVAISVLALLLERGQWHAPGAVAWGAIIYNAVLALGFAQSAWFVLVRALPPVASTLSVMLIPALGVFSGALWLGERLHWQDWAAVALMVLAIASELWPRRGMK
jgi:drug/metabolite transporter (DMT)-like permease